jgi:hypothetical protein
MPRAASSAASTAPCPEKPACIDRHMAAAADLREGDAQGVLGALDIESPKLGGGDRARQEPEQLGGEPALGHGPIR